MRCDLQVKHYHRMPAGISLMITAGRADKTDPPTYSPRPIKPTFWNGANRPAELRVNANGDDPRAVPAHDYHPARYFSSVVSAAVWVGAGGAAIAFIAAGTITFTRWLVSASQISTLTLRSFGTTVLPTSSR